MISQAQVKRSSQKAQAAVEYMLLLAVVVSIVIVGFKKFMPRAYNSSETYYNNVSDGILGGINPCGDGNCHPQFEDREKCPADCP